LQRLWNYALIGRLCTGEWAILKTINSLFTSATTNANGCVVYPNTDIIIAEETGLIPEKKNNLTIHGF